MALIQGRIMKKPTILTLVVMLSSTLIGCVVAPVVDHSYQPKCQISSDRKTLKIIDLAKESNSYYSISGIILTPILVPTTAIISGTYVLVNNSYQLGEQAIKCNS